MKFNYDWLWVSVTYNELYVTETRYIGYLVISFTVEKSGRI